MKLIQHFKYRPEVDGLRALAVIPVVLFHAGLGFPGGFVGVDVFFVISGYLITSLIIKDLEAEKFSMLNFWERRARRILPASTVMVVVTLFFGCLAMTPESSDALGVSASWQSLFAANVYFEQTINYFSGAAEEMPLLHTWSLAVEEQFYCIVPFLLYLLFRIPLFRQRRFVLAALSLGMVASFAFSIFEVNKDASAAFYLLPSRAWELLAGSFVALLPAPNRLSPAVKSTFAWCGIACITAAYFTYDHHTVFPGLMASPPCFGAALFIWATIGLNSSNNTPLIIRCFASKPAVFVGLISYSLYLWHWPIVALANYWGLIENSLLVGISILALSFILAILSWRFVETPFRVRKLGASRKSIFAISGVSIAGVIVLSGVIRKTDGFASIIPGDLSPLSQEAEERRKRRSYTQETSYQDALEHKFLRYGPNSEAGPTLFVWGDSHARSLLPCIKELAIQTDTVAEAAWHGATPPAIDYANSSPWSVGEKSPEYNRAILEYVLSQKIPNVLLVGYWSGYTNGFSRQSTNVYIEDLTELIKRLHNGGTQVWFLLEWPSHHLDGPKLVYAANALSLNLNNSLSSIDSHKTNVEAIISSTDRLIAAGATLLDPIPIFESPGSPHFRIQANGYPIYYDRHHLSVQGSKLLAPLILPAFQTKR